MLEIPMPKRRPIGNLFKMFGKYQADHYRKGLWIARYNINNDITNEGKNLIYDVMFNNVTQIANSAWVLSLISLSGFSALAGTDVMNSHAGWTEFSSYSGGVRVPWGSGSSSSQTITNASPATFNITGSGTVKGIFICSNNTIGGTTGKLWSTALFTADVPVVNGDQLKVTYTLNS